jgi:hypothetical protein
MTMNYVQEIRNFRGIFGYLDVWSGSCFKLQSCVSLNSTQKRLLNDLNPTSVEKVTAKIRRLRKYKNCIIFITLLFCQVDIFSSKNNTKSIKHTKTYNTINLSIITQDNAKMGLQIPWIMTIYEHYHTSN